MYLIYTRETASGQSLSRQIVVRKTDSTLSPFQLHATVPVTNLESSSKLVFDMLGNMRIAYQVIQGMTPYPGIATVTPAGEASSETFTTPSYLQTLQSSPSGTLYTTTSSYAPTYTDFAFALDCL